MTRRRLRQYASLIAELEEETERAEREERHVALMERTYGVGCLFGAEALEAARARLAALTAQREDELHEIRLWVESVPDSLTRRALKLRYLDALPWEEIARRMGYACGSGPRMLCERHIRKEMEK